MTLQETILEQVDEVQLSILDSRMHVIESMVEANMKEYQYLNDCIIHQKEPCDIYQEGFSKTSCKNLVTRLKALTKKSSTVMDTLSGHVKDVMGGFMGKFRKSGAKKSVSAIADENLRKKLDSDKKMSESKARVLVPYEGEQSQTEVELINSAILIKEFINDTEFEVGLIGTNYLKNDKGKMQAIDNKDEGIKSMASLFLYTNSMIYFVKHDSELDKLCDLIVEGFKLVNETSDEQAKKYVKEVSSLVKKANSPLNGITMGGHRLSMKELTEFASKINKIQERLDFSQNGNTDMTNVGSDVVGALNSLVSVTENIQYGLTSLTNSMQKVHLIDLKYMNSIDDRDTLSKFVYDCIQNGIPPKYIAYNTWLIASEKLRGSGTEYKPVGGQTRVVFFPNDNKKEILKIAVSGIGVTSNKNEIRFSKFIKDSKEEEMIKISALVTGSYTEDAILAMERIVDKVGKHPDLAVLNETKAKFKDFTSRHPELRLVVSDFNDGNVMWSSDRDCWVCIDYGLGKRNTKSMKKIERDAEKNQEKFDKQKKDGEL